jgi:hypothetical protein
MGYENEELRMPSKWAGRLAAVAGMFVVLAAALSAKKAWADFDYTTIKTQVDSAKTGFTDIAKVVVDAIGGLIVAGGGVRAAKKVRNNDPHAEDAVIGTGVAAVLLIIVVAIW